MAKVSKARKANRGRRGRPAVSVVDRGGLMPREGFRALLRTLRKLARGAPLDRPVVVRVQGLPGLHGQAQTTRGSHRMWVAPTLCALCVRDTVVHEWAHFGSPGMNHGPEWGVAFAKAYRAATS